MEKVICLMGPTASGKTELAKKLFEHFPVDIISVDSAMVYRGLDIGSAKPTPEELKKVPHRLVNIRNPDEPYSAGEFCTDVKIDIKKILTAGRIPLLVGGTMMYFKALQFGLSVLPSSDDEVRQRLIDEANRFGLEALHDRLMKVDPVSAENIHPQNQQRLLRALEVFEIGGIPMSELHEFDKPKKSPYDFINIVLAPADRAVLHARIAERFDSMLKLGLIDEVKNLRAHFNLNDGLPAMRAVGYRQVWEFLEGRYDERLMREKAIAATRQLAKRQLTWLRHWPSEVHGFDSEAADLFASVVSVVMNVTPAKAGIQEML